MNKTIVKDDDNGLCNNYDNDNIIGNKYPHTCWLEGGRD